MKRRSHLLSICLILYILTSVSTLSAQQDERTYLKSIAKADSLFNAKEYANAASLYNATFIASNNKGKVIDRYNAAICWALSSKPDSAFYQLNRIATLGNFGNMEMLISNVNFESLKNDPRWDRLIKKVKENQIVNDNRLSTIENISDLKQHR